MRVRVPVIVLLVVMGSAGLVACGSDEESAETVTTVIREVQPTTVEKTTTVREPAPKPTPRPAPVQTAAPEPQEPPDVEGLALPQAKKLLSQAGFSASVSNTDTTFGILIPENFTVCKQDQPRGKIVPILAQKHGC